MPKFASEYHQDLSLVWKWFQFQIELIAEKRSQILQTFATKPANRFFGKDREEIEGFFDAQRDHLEYLAMFDILATTEAILRVEFFYRVSRRKKDALSRRFRDINKNLGAKIRLDEDILDTLKQEGVSSSAIGAFRGTLKLRNWLAHGKYWNPKLGQNYTPNDVFDIAKRLLDAVPEA